MPLPAKYATLQPTADSVLTTIQSTLNGKQAPYILAKGTFFQGILTPAALPINGATKSPDLTLKPTDQVDSWTSAGISLPDPMPIAVAVDTYYGPQGSGYVVRGEVILDGVRYVRVVNVGPETWRDQD